MALLGAWGPCDTGWEEVSQRFRWVASRFSDRTEYSFDIMAAGVSGDLAYTVGFERSTVSTDGQPPTSQTLRVTHIYRRENGDLAAADQRQM